MTDKRVEAFEDLDVFQRAYRLSLEIHRKSLGFPPIEQRALGDRLRRASKSICANIAEGFAKQGRSAAEFKRYLLMALGSSDEMRVWARYCLDLGHIDVAAVARRIPIDLEDAAGSRPQVADPVKRRISDFRLLSSDFWTGSGAFRRPVKGSRQGSWRHRK